MNKSAKPSPMIAGVLLAVLVCIVGGVVALKFTAIRASQSRAPQITAGDDAPQTLQQPTLRLADYRPKFSASVAVRAQPDANASNDMLTPNLVDELKPMSDLEAFDKETLSDKIDGKADLYLRADFQSMHCRRYNIDTLPGEWAELFVYDMGTPLNAFSVYGSQKRSDSQDALDVTKLAYATPESVFLVSDKYYLELTSSSSDPKAIDVLKAFAKKFVASTSAVPIAKEPEKSGDPTELFGLFPDFDGVKPDMKLVLDNAFGCEELSQVIVAEYKMPGGKTFVAFAMESVSSTDAAKAFEVMSIDDLGAERVDAYPMDGTDHQWSAEEMASITLCFAAENMLAGVRSMPDVEKAAELAGMILDAIKEKQK